MIKIFLVEDEIVIRNGIKNSIDWEKEGYEFTGEASDGELAYPMIMKEKPDILITDIRMPFMDGLELSKIVKKELPEIKILILSGYNEFDYAKEAIRIGITDYLLKPISSAKLLEALHNVTEVILREREEKELLEHYMREMQENTEHEKYQFFTQLLSGRMSMGEAIESGKKYGLDLSARCYHMILFKLLNSAKNDEQSEQMVAAFEAVEHYEELSEYVFGFQRGVDGWAFLVTGESEENIRETIQSFCGGLRIVMEQYPEIEYFGGTGITVPRLRELRESFREAERVFVSRFVNEPNQILSPEDVREMHDEGTIKLCGLGSMEQGRRLIEKFLGNGTQEETESFVTAYFEEISRDSLRSNLMRQYVIMDIYVTALAFCEKQNLPAEILDEEGSQLKTALQTFLSLEQIKGYVKDLLEQIIVLRDTASGRRYSDIIETAKSYIAENYMSENVSLNTVSASVGMSPSYFSSIFSKEVGQTFVEYLTEVRMEKAKQLLMCSSLKTSEIGYEIGYKDPHYFSYIFKKTQNCTPKDYRMRRKV